MLKRNEWKVLFELRRNARESLTRMSRRTKVPVSTIYDKLKHFEDGFVKKHTTLVDFSQLGFLGRAIVLLKVGIDQRAALRDHLSKHEHVNSLFKVNNGYDFMVEVVFPNLKDVEDFLENLEVQHAISQKEVHYIIDDVAREQFLADPVTGGFVQQEGLAARRVTPVQSITL